MPVYPVGDLTLFSYAIVRERFPLLVKALFSLVQDRQR